MDHSAARKLIRAATTAGTREMAWESSSFTGRPGSTAPTAFATSTNNGDNVITGSVVTATFSQPMDHAKVVSGLHIRPATEVSTAWQGNNLVITPTPHLPGNTPYTVTIDKAAAVAANGPPPPADIRTDYALIAAGVAAALIALIYLILI